MKAVIALSGLAGFLIFGPHLLHSRNAHDHEVVHVDAHALVHAVDGAQDRCHFGVQRSLSAGAGSAEVLRIDAGAGFLEVVGVAGLSEVRASARACASHEEFLEDLRLTSATEGGVLLLRTHYPDQSRQRGWGNRYARLDLTVEVPEGMVLDIDDSSGEISASNLGDITIDDSSGEIELHSILGNVVIDDSSGEITLWDVTGHVEIEDGSGEIEVRGVGGDFTVSDGSGEITATDIEGTVRVISDGSGSIEVDGIGGDFIVQRDGSGGIDFRNVSGKVDVPRKRR